MNGVVGCGVVIWDGPGRDCAVLAFIMLLSTLSRLRVRMVKEVEKCDNLCPDQRTGRVIVKHMLRRA